jgi:hypothetical protein
LLSLQGTQFHIDSALSVFEKGKLCSIVDYETGEVREGQLIKISPCREWLILPPVKPQQTLTQKIFQCWIKP